MKKFTRAIGLSLLLCGCATTSNATMPENCLFQTDEAAVVYSTFQGAQIGFCCTNCQGKFDGMSDEEKSTAISDSKK